MPLVNAYVHDVIGHVRKMFVRLGSVGRGAKHGEGYRVTEEVLERARYQVSMACGRPNQTH